MYYTYILRSLRTGQYYKGLTDNIDQRLMEHNKGQVQSTKRQLPLVLIHVEVCNSRIEVRNLEKYFKSGYGREVIKELDNT